MKKFSIPMIALMVIFETLIYRCAIAAADEIALVTCAGSGQTIFVSVANGQVIKRIDLGFPLPMSVAVTPDAKTAVIAGNFGHIAFIDIGTMAVKSILPLLVGPEQHGITLQPNEFEDVAITPDGSTALVTEANENGMLIFLDIATMTEAQPPLFVGDNPQTIQISSSGTDAVLLDDGNVHIVNLPSRTFTSVPSPTGLSEIGDFAVTPDETRAIFIDCDNRVYLADTATWSILHTLLVDSNHFMEPQEVAIAPDGSLAIVSNSTDQSLTFVEIGTTSLSVLGILPLQGIPHEVAFTSDSQTAVVTIRNTSRVQIVDVPTRTITATLPLDECLAPVGAAVVDIGTEPPPVVTPPSDLDGDGDVDAEDLAVFAGDFGWPVVP